MASAQALPNSKKQEHLEAGKRRLEEFRKKKAAERAKKAATTSQPHALDVSTDQKEPLETEHVRLTNSDGAGTSNGPIRTDEPFGLSLNNGKTVNAIKGVEENSLKDADANVPSMIHSDTSFADLVQRHSNDYDFKRFDASGFTGVANGNYGQGSDKMNNEFGLYAGSQDGLPSGISVDQSISQRTQSSPGFGSVSILSSLYETEPFQSKENNIILKDSAVMNPGSHILSSSNSTSYLPQKNPSNSSTLANGVDTIEPNSNFKGPHPAVDQDMHRSLQFNDSLISNFREGNFSSLASGLSSVHDAAVLASEPMGFSSDVRNTSNHGPLYSATSETNSSRSRPSFLDSLNVSRPSMGTYSQRTELGGAFSPSNSKSDGMDDLGSFAFVKPFVETQTVGPFSKLTPSIGPSAFDRSMKSSVSFSEGVDLQRLNASENGVARKQEFYAPEQNEDFAALEQHIEDLTQEKFSLQRALEASRALAESLAAENSSLTDNYNQQRTVVNQLKSDLEKLQEEIKAHLLELESVKIEYTNAQLECNAADERAKLLASEVIALEEKALRLRSNELKLERELENSQAEITSYKKKMSSLERERQDLQSTINALQEEKKLTQSKLWKASGGGKPIDINMSRNKKDVSTSTEDLAEAIPDTSNQETDDATSLLRSETSAFLVLPETEQPNQSFSSVYIPPDHMRMVQNINALISELALEKEDLIQSLASETSQCSKLKDLNKELLLKLEAQTQRLELLTAQSMAVENIPARLVDSQTRQDSTTYADEGDEVVERVLGWIMKLFPGGPSRRRTSKLL